MQNDKTKASEEQMLYANILSWGTLVGIITLVTTFFLYVFNVLSPVIPIERLPELWKLKAHDYLHEGHLPKGWGWVSYAGHGDFINFIGIVMLAGLSVVSYLAILPIMIRKKDTAFAIMIVAEVLILLLAASGILTAGGH